MLTIIGCWTWFRSSGITCVPLLKNCSTSRKVDYGSQSASESIRATTLAAIFPFTLAWASIGNDRMANVFTTFHFIIIMVFGEERDINVAPNAPQANRSDDHLFSSEESYTLLSRCDKAFKLMHTNGYYVHRPGDQAARTFAYVVCGSASPHIWHSESWERPMVLRCF